jgi:hypothetical protein
MKCVTHAGLPSADWAEHSPCHHALSRERCPDGAAGSSGHGVCHAGLGVREPRVPRDPRPGRSRAWRLRQRPRRYATPPGRASWAPTMRSRRRVSDVSRRRHCREGDPRVSQWTGSVGSPRTTRALQPPEPTGTIRTEHEMIEFTESELTRFAQRCVDRAETAPRGDGVRRVHGLHRRHGRTQGANDFPQGETESRASRSAPTSGLHAGGASDLSPPSAAGRVRVTLSHLFAGRWWTGRSTEVPLVELDGGMILGRAHGAFAGARDLVRDTISRTLLLLRERGNLYAPDRDAVGQGPRLPPAAGFDDGDGGGARVSETRQDGAALSRMRRPRPADGRRRRDRATSAGCRGIRTSGMGIAFVTG